MISIPSDPGLSRLHARFALVQGVWTVEDLGSTNGTKLNGQRIGGMVPLAVGDVVEFGAQAWRFDQIDSAFDARGQVATGPPLNQTVAFRQPENPGYGHPVPAPPQPSPWQAAAQPMPPAQPTNSISVTGGRNMTLLWVFLCLLALGPCGLAILGVVAIAVAPYVLMGGGMMLLLYGLIEWSRLRGWPHTAHQASKMLLCACIGIGMIIVGGIWYADLKSMPPPRTRTPDSPPPPAVNPQPWPSGQTGV